MLRSASSGGVGEALARVVRMERTMVSFILFELGPCWVTG